jgi:hypothetical protein
MSPSNVFQAPSLSPSPSARFQVTPASQKRTHYGSAGGVWSAHSKELASPVIDDANRKGAYFKKTAESLRLGSGRH